MIIKVLQYIMTVVMTVCDNILKQKVVIINQKTVHKQTLLMSKTL